MEEHSGCFLLLLLPVMLVALGAERAILFDPRRLGKLYRLSLRSGWRTVHNANDAKPTKHASGDVLHQTRVRETARCAACSYSRCWLCHVDPSIIRTAAAPQAALCDQAHAVPLCLMPLHVVPHRTSTITHT